MLVGVTVVAVVTLNVIVGLWLVVLVVVGSAIAIACTATRYVLLSLLTAIAATSVASI